MIEPSHEYCWPLGSVLSKKCQSAVTKCKTPNRLVEAPNDYSRQMGVLFQTKHRGEGDTRLVELLAEVDVKANRHQKRVDLV